MNTKNLVSNPDALAAVVAADMRATAMGVPAPFTEMQPLYVAANTHGLDLDAPISRIMQLQFLLEDFRAKQLSHLRIVPTVVWKDPLENPLLHAKFDDPITDGKIHIDKLMGSYFALCWTREIAEHPRAWKAFGKQMNFVRVTSTARKLLTALMDSTNPYYMLQHHIIAVRYQTVAEIEAWRKALELTDLIDSRGDAINASLTVLREQYANQKEARLLFNYIDENSPWEKQNVTIESNIARIPFDWSVALDSITLHPSNSKKQVKSMQADISAAGITCPILASALSRV